MIKNFKTTLENSEIIQTLIKVLNSPDGYKIVFLSRLTPVRRQMIPSPLVYVFDFRFLLVCRMDSIRSVMFLFAFIFSGQYAA